MSQPTNLPDVLLQALTAIVKHENRSPERLAEGLARKHGAAEPYVDVQTGELVVASLTLAALHRRGLVSVVRPKPRFRSTSAGRSVVRHVALSTNKESSRV